jgi:hypothetical protein
VSVSVSVSESESVSQCVSESVITCVAQHSMCVYLSSRVYVMVMCMGWCTCDL